ncbi:MAG: carboxypeptidase M32 [Candidatus Paceibacterota bacterium]|jgi:carboxypeptidase Taq
MKTAPITELKKRLTEVSHLSSILRLLGWDQNIYMPKKGDDLRSASASHLSGLIHRMFVDIDSDGLLTKLKKDIDAKKIKGKDVVIVEETWRSFERERKLPEDFVKELVEVTSKAQGVWAEARKKNDFALFLPWLTKIVNLKRKEAELVGFLESPYDALIDFNEPGMTTSEASKILVDLKDFLVPFIQNNKSFKKKINSAKVFGKFPISKQITFNEMVIARIGFDMEAGRLDITTHPFAEGLHPHDVRLATRYRENDILYSLGSTIHEAGHGIYEQGLPAEHFGTPLGESISLGIHESQSRMWENIIGKSKSFWKHFYPQLQKEFPKPFKRLPLDDFLAIINKVEHSFIRTEADEVTYNLHIILRFEIEKDLIEGKIQPKDLPNIWKEKVKEYFGIDVPTDSLGVLQDVHWSAGLFGYFPTYAFGNLYSAQFFAKMKKDIPDIEKQISKGKFEEINKWLRKNIHTHGKTYTAAELVKKVTGEKLNSSHFIEYLKKKYR